MHVLTLRLTREVFVGPKGDFVRVTHWCSQRFWGQLRSEDAVTTAWVSCLLEWNGSIRPSLRLSNSVQSNLLVGPDESPWVKDPKPSR